MNFKELGKNIGLEEDEYIEMMELFIESGGGDLIKLETAVKEGNAEKAHESSHSIKGSSGSLMLNDLYEIAKLIDDTVRTGKLDGVNEMVEKLRDEYESLKSAILKSIENKN